MVSEEDDAPAAGAAAAFGDVFGEAGDFGLGGLFDDRVEAGDLVDVLFAGVTFFVVSPPLRLFDFGISSKHSFFLSAWYTAASPSPLVSTV